MPIRRLPEDVTFRIAAGEVIERPASVVKELLENALDAGASRVTVRLVQGGTLSIVIEDDGCGIAAEELPLAVERFATSKLYNLEDLERITTLGFRGEALASIATVSRFEIRSRRKGSNPSQGAFIRIEGGTFISGGSLETIEGTRVQVDDLFYNLPARRKFLKGSASEQRRILKVIQETAISAPHVALLLVADGKNLFRWEGGARGEALKSVMSSPEVRVARFERGPVRAETWRSNARPGRRADITSFVNGRRVTEPTIRSAIFALGPETAGDWVIIVECPPDDVDVNIHPAKAEIRFRHSGAIFEAVHGAAKALVAVPSELPIPFAPAADYSFPLQANLPAWPRVSSPAVHEVRIASTEPAAENDSQTGSDGVSFLGSFSEGFLVYATGDDLVLVDPHAAHERILFDRLRALLEGPIPSQKIAIGHPLPPSLSSAVAEFGKPLSELGFSFSTNDDGTLLLDSVPAFSGLEAVFPHDLLRGALDAMDEKSDEPLGNRLAERWAYAACHGAVKLGDELTPREALALWEQLAFTRTPQACPHGRPTLLRLSGTQLKRHFGRRD